MGPGINAGFNGYFKEKGEIKMFGVISEVMHLIYLLEKERISDWKYGNVPGILWGELRGYPENLVLYKE